MKKEIALIVLVLFAIFTAGCRDSSVSPQLSVSTDVTKSYINYGLYEMPSAVLIVDLDARTIITIHNNYVLTLLSEESRERICQGLIEVVSDPVTIFNIYSLGGLDFLELPDTILLANESSWGCIKICAADPDSESCKKCRGDDKSMKVDTEILY